MNAEDQRRVQWCIDNIPGFKAKQAQAAKARAEQDENKRQYGALLAAQKQAELRAMEAEVSK